MIKIETDTKRYQCYYVLIFLSSLPNDCAVPMGIGKSFDKLYFKDANIKISDKKIFKR